MERNLDNTKESKFEQIWFGKILRLIYPKVRQDKVWHRIVTVIGWVVSIFTYLILLPIYFGIVQRVIYYIAYGDNKDEWLIEN